MATSTYRFFCFTRKFRHNETQPPADVRAAFKEYADGDGAAGLSAEGFRRFLIEAQKETVADAAEAGRIADRARQLHAAATAGAGSVKSYLGIFAKHGSSFLSVDEFYRYLFSDELNPPIKHEVHQDMTAPLSHYYVYTGHNSYLTGNQLSSECSDLPIIKALQKGVRVIELDMWPNSTKDDVHILHGRTLTTPVDIRKCLRSIKEYAFCASPYPVIITLEDHLTPNLQAKVAEMIKETFGELLYVPGSDPLKEFPSPENLKKRIIISTKPPKEYLESKDCKSESKKEKKSTKELEEEEQELEGIDCKSEESNDKEEEESGEESEDDPKFRKNSSDQYRNLITIQAGKPKGSMGCALNVDLDRVRRLSLSEQQLAKAVSSHCSDVIRFTQRNLLRIYPKGTRINSSNFNPLLAWMHGAQMVAFNMQGHGKSLRLMQGFFRANGGCGYVKKPDFLLKNGPNGEVFDPNANIPVKKTLKVKVYMGDGWRMDFSKTHFDTYSPPDFYTRIGIAGDPADTIMKKTRTIEDEWVPIWDEEFTFPLTVPELALLRVEVQDYNMSEKHDFGGQTCLPVSELRTGIRAVPLYDKKGAKYKSVRLLMHFEFV